MVSVFPAVRFIHFHGWLFGFSPYRLNLVGGDRVRVTSKLTDFIPTMMIVVLGSYVFQQSRKYDISGINSDLEVVSILSNVLMRMQFAMFVWATLLSFSLRFQLGKLIEDLLLFDKEVSEPVFVTFKALFFF